MERGSGLLREQRAHGVVVAFDLRASRCGGSRRAACGGGPERADRGQSALLGERKDKMAYICDFS